MKNIHAVGVIFENEHGEILVLRRHPQDPEGTTWGLVGGKVEAGEDEVTAAKREVQEEIGHSLDTDKLQHLKTYHWERDDADITFAVFIVSSRQNSIVLTIDQTEHTEHLWTRPEELYRREDLMTGLYPILEDRYKLTR